MHAESTQRMADGSFDGPGREIGAVIAPLSEAR